MPERIAFLVIHGIGQERPYETLDRFTRNLKNCLPGDWNIEPRLDRATDPTHVSAAWIRAALRLSPSQSGTCTPYKSDPASSYRDITLYEYYWAPITQDKVTYRGSLLFLFKAGLKPFLNLSSNVAIISRVSGGRVGQVFRREIWRQVCLFLPLLALIAWLGLWLGSASVKLYFHDFKPNLARVFVLCMLAIRYLFLYTCIRGLARAGLAKKSWQSSGKWRSFLWFGVACHIVLWPLCLAPVVRLIADFGSLLARPMPSLRVAGHWSAACRRLAELVSYPHKLTDVHTTPFAWLPQHSWEALLNGLHKAAWLLFLDPSLADYFKPAVALLLAFWLRYILKNIVGDIAVYANADTFASSYAARTQILEECSSALTAILLEQNHDRTPKYDRVLVAAHSLGTIIAYDTMNQVRNAIRTAASPSTATFVSGISSDLEVKDLERLRGLVTFGCPLNKFFYFFRDMGDRTLTLRAQTLNLLHGFRLHPAILADVEDPIFNYTPPSEWLAADAALAKNFVWINVYSPRDPISGRLLFHVLNPDDQLLLPHMTLLVAHVQYWERSDFYTFLSAKLL